MRLILGVLFLSLSACTGDVTDGSDGTDGTDTNIDDGTHPLVPEEYKFLWNTDGECSTEFGDGNQMYMIFEGRLEADGSLTGTEQVWWFYADQGQEEDCVDTFELTGTRLSGSAESLGCVGCESFYQTRREITENNCRARYNGVYQSDDDGLYQRLMLDTLNEFNDQPNENNKVAVFHEERNWQGGGTSAKLYAGEDGSLLDPDTAVHDAPADIRWIGSRCQVSFGGGGGGGGGGS
ncbi:MAG: hypothetical protein AB8H79_19420 [Myxococcota bacterium]